MIPEPLSARAWALACGGPYPDPADLVGDEHFMALALREALKGVGHASPNPPVGCVLVREGEVLGRGVHTRAGDPHAEVMSLRHAEEGGLDPAGSTAFVTLEPCCHQGRTPPCTDALLRAGVAEVVVGVRDPNPRVAGGGISILRQRGVKVREGVLGEACGRFHAPFFKWILSGLPWVSLKLALDPQDRMGVPGFRTEVTPPELQALAHALRRASDGVLVGRATAQVDDPRLSDRWPARSLPHRVFRRVVLDTRGRLPATLQIWRRLEGQPCFRVLAEEARPLPDVEDLRVPPGPGGCSLRHLLQELGARGVSRLLVEGGPTLHRALLAEGLADELHLFRGAAEVGGAPIHLPVTQEWSRRARLSFQGGTWEILENPTLAHPFHWPPRP